MTSQDGRAALVLGVDPGLLNTGYALLERAQGRVGVASSGVITTSTRQPFGERLGRIYEGLRGLLDERRPRLLVLEDLYADYNFPKTAIQMGHARGVVCLAAYQVGVEVVNLGAAEVKRAVTGNGRASKQQVQETVNHLLGLGPARYPDHISDALALAFTAMSRQR